LLAALLTAYGRGMIGQRTAGACLLTLMIIELGNSEGYYSFAHYASKDKRWDFVTSLSENDEIAGFLRAQPQPLRASMNRDDVPVNFGDLYGIDTVEAYLAGMTTEVAQLEWSSHRVASMLGANYLIARKARDGVQEVFSAKNGMKVFRNPDAFPRAWTVHHATQMPVGKVNDFVNHGMADLSVEAALSDPPPSLQTCADGDQVRRVQEQIQSVDVEVTMGCRGLVVVSDSWYPGWVATVDGAETKILKVDGATRGVVVEKGTHHIHMIYRPTSVLLGFAGTLTGLAIVAFLWWRPEEDGIAVMTI
jgi:hypothetical protein